MSNRSHRFARTIITVLLAARFVGCATEPRTPFGTGPQEDPRREMRRLGYLINLGKLKPDEDYAARMKLIELQYQANSDPLHRHGEAIGNYKDLVRKYPDRREGPVQFVQMIAADHRQRGRGYHNVPAEAEKWLSNLIAKNPSDGELYLLRFQMARFGAKERLQSDLKQAARLLPNDPRVKLEIAEHLALGGSRDDLLKATFDAQKVNPGSPDVHYLYGYRAQMVGDRKEALRQYDLALSINPRDIDALAGRCMIQWAETGKTPREDWARLNALNPIGNASVRFLKGLEAWDTRRHKEAIDYVQWAIQADPDNLLYRRTRDEMVKRRNDLYKGIAIAAGAILVGAMAIGTMNDTGAGGNSNYPIDLPTGSDPDSLRRRQDALDMRRAIEAEERAQSAAREQTRLRMEAAARAEAERQRIMNQNYRGQRGY